MKFKSFIAMLVTGLLCITSFSACSDDDDDSKQYFYEFSIELTDPGSLTTDEIQTTKTALGLFESSTNSELSTMTLTPANAKKLLRNLAKKLQEASAETGSTLTKAVVYTLYMENESTGKIECTETVTIQPGK